MCLCSLAHSSYLHLLQGKILDDEYLCSERALPYECAVSLVSHSDEKNKKQNKTTLCLRLHKGDFTNQRVTSISMTYCKQSVVLALNFLSVTQLTS